MEESKKRPHPNDTPESQQPPQKKTVIYREPSIFGYKPIDDITKYIANFIAEHVKVENVEIEAKLGIFIDKRTKQRLNMGAVTETVLLDRDFSRQYRFESNMPLEQHAHYNKILNDTVNRSKMPEHRGERVEYKHTRETDRFYELPNSRGKCRVTTVKGTGEVVPNGIIEKIRVADLNIHSPNQPLDYRISVNIEKPREKPNSAPVYERNKDRISYKHGGIAFDLTQVKGSADRDPDTRHELELEFSDPKLLAHERSKQERKESSQYSNMIEVFVNNIRLLSQHAIKLQ